MILRRKFVWVIGEVWFEEEPDTASCDILWRRQHGQKPASGACETKHTIKVNLSLPETEIWNGITKDTRYEIRRADAKDALRYVPICKPGETEIAEFVGFYEKFARQKGLEQPQLRHLKSYGDSQALALSVVKREEQTLVWHAYYAGATTARLLHSASLYRSEESAAFRQLLGRANRWHHWQDIRFLRDRGLRCYDFGGWYAGDSDEALLRINKFKEEFGGTMAVEYNYFEALTWKGRLLLWAKSVLRG